MAPLDLISIRNKIHAMIEDVKKALETANYDKLLQSGLQVIICNFSKRYGLAFHSS